MGSSLQDAGEAVPHLAGHGRPVAGAGDLPGSMRPWCPGSLQVTSSKYSPAGLSSDTVLLVARLTVSSV